MRMSAPTTRKRPAPRARSPHLSNPGSGTVASISALTATPDSGVGIQAPRRSSCPGGASRSRSGCSFPTSGPSISRQKQASLRVKDRTQNERSVIRVPRKAQQRRSAPPCAPSPPRRVSSSSRRSRPLPGAWYGPKSFGTRAADSASVMAAGGCKSSAAWSLRAAPSTFLGGQVGHTLGGAEGGHSMTVAERVPLAPRGARSGPRPRFATRD